MNKTKIIIIATIILICSIAIVYKIIDIVKGEGTEIIYSNIISENIIDNQEQKNDTYQTTSKIKIHIIGEVTEEGIIELEEGERISDAIEKAGGVTQNADLSKVNLAYILQDGQKLYIPSMNDDNNVQYISTENGEGIIAENNINDKSGINKKVNINKASQSDLENIPGVGPSLAQKIISFRDENGKFKNVEDLKNVSGIGDKKLESIKDYVDVK